MREATETSAIQRTQWVSDGLEVSAKGTGVQLSAGESWLQDKQLFPVTP